jgi:hypothetical protein
VVQRHLGVPERIPDLVGDVRDVRALPVVDEDEVQVASGRRLATSEGADGDKGDSRPRRAQQFPQPAVGSLGQCMTQGRPLETGPALDVVQGVGRW